MLRGWGAYFRSGNAAVKFVQVDRYVVERLHGLRIKRAGSQLRSGQAETWHRPFFEVLGLCRLGGTIQHPGGGVKPLPQRSLGSRVREIRTHGLNGVLPTPRPSPRLASSRIYQLTGCLALAPGTRLGAYEIVALIGSGGMGEVYRARDPRLGRDVAIKILPSTVIGDPDRLARFAREAHIASSLNHPHILIVHDVGEVQRQPYFVSEYVDGGTLRQWMRGTHGWRDTVDLLVGAADGLAAAHQAGILHRDLKPENILIATNGYAKLADFGLAKLADDAPPPDEATIADLRTRAGVIIGTAAYMSPEQAVGQPLDARSDIFSFGVILYEALIGRRPFTGDSDVEIMRAVVHRAIEPLPEDMPVALRMVLEKALEKDPTDRYQSMRDLVVDLRRLVRPSHVTQQRAKLIDRLPRWSRYLLAASIIMIVLVIAGGLRWLVRSRTPATAPDARIRSIAVLPLTNLSNDQTQAYFVDGMQEALITQLAQIGLQKVIAKPSADTFKGSTKLPREIGQALGVDGLIIGSVMRAENRVRVTAQLVRAETGEVLWANRFERTTADVLALQNDLVAAIAQEVRANVNAEQRARLTAAHAVNPAANDAYLRARSFYVIFVNSEQKKPLDDAIAEYERAIAMDPTFAPPYAYLSLAYQTATQVSFAAPQQTFPKARAAAIKAVQLDDGLPAAHAALAGVYLTYDWNWDAAEREIDRALQLNPESIDALVTSEMDTLLVRDRPDQAAATSQRILDLDPLNPFARLQTIWVAFFSRQYDESVRRAKMLNDLMPNNPITPFFLASNYAVKGMAADVAVQCEALMKALGGLYEMQPISTCVWAYGRVGRLGEARRLLGILERPPEGMWLDPSIMAISYAGLGDIDRSYEWAHRAIEERVPNMVYVKVGPPWDPLRGDPRFELLLQQMNFPPK